MTPLLPRQYRDQLLCSAWKMCFETTIVVRKGICDGYLPGSALDIDTNINTMLIANFTGLWSRLLAPYNPLPVMTQLQQNRKAWFGTEI